MLSTRTWGKLFGKKPPQQLPPEELERRFWESENDRTHTFEQTCRQQQHEFSVAVTQWTKGEDSRIDTFQVLVKEMQETFAKDQAGRDTEFQELLVEHDTIVRSHEDERNAAFDDASATRLKVFEAAQEQREKVVEKLISFQEQLCEQGRTSRRAECQELIKFLREEFSKMIQVEGAAYLTAQNQREKRLILFEERRRMDEVKVNMPDPEPTRGRTSRKSSSRPGSYPQSRSPRRSRRSPPIVVHARSRSERSPRRSYYRLPVTRRSESRHDVPRSPVFESESKPPEMPTPDTLVSHYPRRLSLMQILDAAFYSHEEQRQTSFLEDQHRRGAFFEQVRAYIEQGGTRRQSQIKELGNHLEQVFSDSQSHYKQTLAARRKVWDETEAYRDQVFEEARVQMETIFEDALSHMEGQSAGLGVVQAEDVQWCYKEVDGLLAGMDDIVRQIKVSFESQFLNITSTSEKQSRNPADQLPPAVIIAPLHPQTVVIARTRSRSPYYARERRSSYSPYRCSRRWFRSRSRSRTPVRRSVDPFAPQVLLQGNILSKELPIHISDAQMEQTTEQIAQGSISHSFRHSIVFRQHVLIFSRAQDSRHITFVTLMHKLHLETATLHLQAQLTFRAQQRVFEQETETQRLNQARRFQANQQIRNDSFSSDESDRQERFRRQQRSRREWFQSAQRGRNITFERRRQDLQRSFMKAEAERAQEFLAWEERVTYQMQGKIREWQTGFAEDEREREKRLDVFTT